MNQQVSQQQVTQQHVVKQQVIRECYGFRVVCSVHPEALGVVDAFFGPAGPDPDRGPAQEVRLAFDVVGSTDVPSSDPPHTEEVIAADPVVIDTGGSRAVITPGDWSATITLSRRDLADQIVWGRWILERLFLYLVCRSPRHYPLHAGAVGLDGRTVLVSAPTGTGKSTLCFWCLHRGFDLLGEDIMVRHLDDPPGRVWGHPRVVYLDAGTLARAPELDPALISPVDGAGKSRVRLPENLAGRLHPRADPASVLFLARPDDRDHDGSGAPARAGHVRALSVDEAVERCRDDVMTGKPDPGVRSDVERDLRALLGAVPLRELTLTTDLDDGVAAARAQLRAPLLTSPS